MESQRFKVDADALAILVAMFKLNQNAKIQPIKLSLREKLAHCLNVEKEVNGKPWYFDILQHRSRDQTPLRCVNVAEAKKLLEEIHRGICETHANGNIMTKQITRA
ncbi:uncharacterized protein LOC111307087 [Durio zibethinus]|uniref:Uncharacterized protein LOC111307087 n=1 Tax=Durio zibethinus TaxID=66656 RepID=A0A6P6A7G4_DURZI|nr:uncharacterized protein LOC111307087 [Durio zibethinus]